MEEVEAEDPLFRLTSPGFVPKENIFVLDVDAADGSGASGVLKATPIFELFLLSALSGSGDLGTESIAPAATVDKLYRKQKAKIKFLRPIIKLQYNFFDKKNYNTIMTEMQLLSQ